jgi:hypothetical protein
MGLPKCLSGYSSISWTFTECEKQMNIICFRKKSKNFLGILTFGASLELPELLQFGKKIALDLNLTPEGLLCSHALIFPVSISSSQFL